MARRSGLGRGLGALIPTEVQHPSSALQEVPLAEVRPNPFQPRKEFSEEALSSLVDSIRAVGVLQPVLLRPVDGGGFELIAGERRCRAARRAGLQTIPALVQDVNDATSLEQALIENIQREQLNVLDEAAAYQQLIEEFSLTHDEVARRVGRSRVAVTNALRLFQLPLPVQRLVRDERLTAGHARALLGTPDREVQESLARRAVDEGLSVRAVERMIRELAAGDEMGEDAAGADGSVVADGVVLGQTADPPADPPVAPPVDLDEAAGAGWAAGQGALRSPAGPALVPPAGPGSPWAGEGDGAAVTSWSWAGADEAAASPAEVLVGGPERGDGAGALRPTALRPPGFLELEELLADHLDTRVRVEMSARHGRVVIDFATLEDLERIYRVMVEGRPS